MIIFNSWKATVRRTVQHVFPNLFFCSKAFCCFNFEYVYSLFLHATTVIAAVMHQAAASLFHPDVKLNDK